MAAAHVLHYGVGIPVRRVPVVLRALTGMELSQGAITQDALRRAQGAVGDAYQRLRESVRESRIVHTDDTGWRVGGEGAFLMAFETDEATVYQVRARHRNAREVVPSEYGGVMVTDRGRSYDAQALSGVRQQKCLAHVLRSISEVVQTKRGRGRIPDRSRGHGFGKRLSGLLREAMELRQSYRRGEASDYVAETERLRREVSYHLRDRPMPDRDNGRLQNELGWHDDRGNLLRFLDDPGIEPTNNRAERALRGAVIARKVSHCSKNEDGADAFSAFTSVIRTLARNGGDQSLVDGLCGVTSTPAPPNLFPTSTPPLINYILDIGTARGFSAITMARALLDANLDGMVYSVDVIDHRSKLIWHGGKHDPEDPLANTSINRSEVWSCWFEEEASCVTPLHGQSHEILENWSIGPIDIAFIDGEHTYNAVKRDLSLLEGLMTPTGVVVLDDYHTGVSIGALRSRPVNGAVRLMGRAAKHIWPTLRERLRLGVGNEFLVVKRRYAGIYGAVNEFLMERSSEWALEIVPMPPRGDYHEADYSLALLTRRSITNA